MELPRTDLALELARSASSTAGLRSQTRRVAGMEITSTDIDTPEAAQALGKPRGRYLTLQTKPLWQSSLDQDDAICAAAHCLRQLLPANGCVLVAGLGNSDITPDALGPRTINGILATRHLSHSLCRSLGLENLRAVCAIAPGVMGQTGAETGEILAALVRQLRPSAVIAVDALAARDTQRLGTTIQISDTGIAPGSGVLNARRELCRRTLGVPVISMGIPTVVDASGLIPEPPSAHSQPLMVTPREIDLLIGHGARFLAGAINKALQPQLSLEELRGLCS